MLGEVATLRQETKLFTDAVRAGDVAEAKEQFAPSRVSWERIEPIAGLVEDIDSAVDARVDDFANEDDPKWTGWHKLEYLLWVKNTASGGKPLADKLDKDLGTLETQLKTVEITPKAVALGAGELIEEVSKGKITGEEDRYSHTDLWDFAANVDGAKAAYGVFKPVLSSQGRGAGQGAGRALRRGRGVAGAVRGSGGGYKPYTAPQAGGQGDDAGAAWPRCPRTSPSCRPPWAWRERGARHDRDLTGTGSRLSAAGRFLGQRRSARPSSARRRRRRAAARPARTGGPAAEPARPAARVPRGAPGRGRSSTRAPHGAAGRVPLRGPGPGRARPDAARAVGRAGGAGPAGRRRTVDAALPPADNGVLDEVTEPGLVATSVGASLFDDRYGLAERKPRELVTMPFLANDRLDPARSHGDLLLVLQGKEPDVCLHALRRAMRRTRSGLVLHWMLEAFTRPDANPRVGQTQSRNLLGFKDGTANPDAGDAALMDISCGRPGRATAAEPAWTVGGTLPGGPGHPDVRRALGPDLAGRAGGDHRPAQGVRRAAAARAPRPTSRTTPTTRDGEGPAGRAHPAGQPAHPGPTEKGWCCAAGSATPAAWTAPGSWTRGWRSSATSAGSRTSWPPSDGSRASRWRSTSEPEGGGFFFVLPGVTRDGDWLGRSLLEA